MVSYPRNTSSSSNKSDRYTAVIVPADLVHVKIGVSPPPGIIVTIHAIPPQFPLAMIYIETLVSGKYNFEYKSELELVKMSEPGDSEATKDGGLRSPWRNFETVIIPPPVLLHISELMGGYLSKTEIPALIKESVFHVLAQTLRVFHQSETRISDLIPAFSPTPSPSLVLQMQLQTELWKLYEDETKDWPSGTTVSGPGIGLGYTDHGRFSTYFHCLMEVNLAIAEVNNHLGPHGGLVGPRKPDEAGAKSSTSLPSQAPTSPLATGKRKKLRAKRERDRGPVGSRRSGSPRRHSESDDLGTSPPISEELLGGPLSSNSSSSTGVGSLGGAAAASSSSNLSSRGSKSEDMLWFRRAVTMSQILRHLAYGDPQGENPTNDAIADAHQSLLTPTAHSRLLVISGIPASANITQVRKAILKTCNANGGLYCDEIYLPTAAESMACLLIDRKPSDTLEAVGQSRSDTQQGSDTALKQTSTDDKEEELIPPSAQPAGFAVIELRSRTKVDATKKALLKSKVLTDAVTRNQPEFVDVPEEMLSISAINPQMFADSHGGMALENYLWYKLVAMNGPIQDLNDSMMIVLTEIFHSCFITDQRVSLVERQESGYICLGKEQIMIQAPGNLLFTFFTSIRAVKKTFVEQVNYILRRYGIPKLADKEEYVEILVLTKIYNEI